MKPLPALPRTVNDSLSCDDGSSLPCRPCTAPYGMRQAPGEDDKVDQTGLSPLNTASCMARRHGPRRGEGGGALKGRGVDVISCGLCTAGGGAPGSSGDSGA